MTTTEFHCTYYDIKKLNVTSVAFHATLIKLTNKADFRVARPSFSSSLSAAARALLSSVQHASHYNQEPPLYYYIQS